MTNNSTEMLLMGEFYQQEPCKGPAKLQSSFSFFLFKHLIRSTSYRANIKHIYLMMRGLHIKT